MEYYNTTGKSVQDGIYQNVSVNDLNVLGELYIEGGVTGNSVVSSGSYDPIVSGVTGIASSPASNASWIRVGNQVQVTGQTEVVTNASLDKYIYRISLPIASDLTSDQGDCVGTASFFMGLNNEVQSSANLVLPDASTNTAEIQHVGIPAGCSGNCFTSFVLNYKIL